MSADRGLRGLDLLDAAIAHIEAHPEEWRQETYRCSSGMCLAGHVCELAGGEWAEPPGGLLQGFLLVMPGEVPDRFHPSAVSARRRAERLLGFSEYMDEALGRPGDGRALFGATNRLRDLKAMRDDLRARAAEVTP